MEPDGKTISVVIHIDYDTYLRRIKLLYMCLSRDPGILLTYPPPCLPKHITRRDVKEGCG